MFHPRLKGSYYEMGHHYGSILHKHGFKLGQQPSEKLSFGRESEQEVKRVFPEVLEEIRGLAEACEVPYEDLAAFILGVGAFKPSCSAFAVHSGSDVLFGRNYDFYYRFKKYTEASLTCPDTGYYSIGHSDIFVGREDGVNEEGLAVAITFVGTIITKHGVNFALATRLLLDKCANAEDAVRTLSGVHFSTSNNYLLADRQGNMAVVEASPEKIRVRKPDEQSDFIAATNHFLHPEMVELEDLTQRDADTVTRYTAITNAIKMQAGKIDLRTAQNILSAHNGYVCSHHDIIDLGTIWSVVARLRQLRILRAEGHPCTTKYKPDTRLKQAAFRRSGAQEKG